MSGARPLDLAGAAALLRSGGIVAYPTETFYGLGALWHRREALQRLATAKLRPAGKPLPLLCGDRAQLGEVAGPLPPEAERLAARFWPGPLTLVLPAAAGVPEEITAGSATVGVRIPGSALARALAAAAGGALVSTSANPAGGPAPRSAAELAPAIQAAIDGVLDGGVTPGGLPSTVVALGPHGPALVRAGVIPWDAVLGALREPN